MVLHWRKLLGTLVLTGTALAASAEEGVTDSTILLGQTVGLTGTVAGPVKETNEGANAYFAMINKQGGVHGRKIELLTLDDKFDPKLTLANAETLIKKDHVFALLQGRGTPHTQGILPLLSANRVPLVAPSTGATVLHNPVNPWLFNIRARYQEEIAKGVEHFSTLGFKNIALLHVDDAFGQDCLEGFQKAMAAHNLKPVLITKFGRVNPDYAAAARSVIAVNPNALIISSSSKNTIEVIKAIRAQGGTMQIMTQSNNSSASFVKELGPTGAGVIVTQITPAPHLVSTTLGQEFGKAAKATGATISYAAMEGFVRAMESMERVDFGGLMVTYGPNDHSGSEFVELTMIGKDGRFIR